MVNDRLGKWLFKLVLLTIILLRAEGLYVPIIYVQNAVAKGAVCLDGSPPAYHFDKGFGSGINNWVVDIEGGGWCNNISTCLQRKNNHLGSSKLMLKELPFSGIMSNRPEFNPDFYNWNRVAVRYCDGSSFTGDVEAVNPATNLHFRGARVFSAVMEDLLPKGLKNAKNAILSGCSAGGLATILHCDSFSALLPLGAKVKCLSDAGFFINTKDISGGQHIQAYFNDVVTTHGSAKNLPSSCTSKMNPSLCFFPQYFAQQIRTPVFLVNAAYDYWQVRNALVPASADPQGGWKDCKLDIAKCQYPQLKVLQDFRMQFLRAITGLSRPPSRGMFINSCYAHCQTSMQDFWFSSISPKLSNTTIAKSVGDWFYDRKPFQMIDCPYPCDKTCHKPLGDPNKHRI